MAELTPRHPAWWLATWFGAGLLPKAPGTWGSLAALPCAWVIHQAGGAWALAGAAVLVFAIGCWAAGRYAAGSEHADPGAIVIDEVAGQWLTLVAAPLHPLAYLMGFLLFRAADILKPWPAGWADRHLTGGLGIMLDDMLAAVWSGGLLYLVILWVVQLE